MSSRDEEGQALVLALAFLAFFGLVIAALLSFASASMLSASQLREQRSAAYTADGAIDAAINVARSDRNVGAFGAVPCMDASPFTVTTSDTISSTVATVDCSSLAAALDQDRTVRFTASVGGSLLVVTKVIFHDSAAATGTLPVSDVEVQQWTYCGHSAAAC